MQLRTGTAPLCQQRRAELIGELRPAAAWFISPESEVIRAIMLVNNPHLLCPPPAPTLTSSSARAEAAALPCCQPQAPPRPGRGRMGSRRPCGSGHSQRSFAAAIQSHRQRFKSALKAPSSSKKPWGAASSEERQAPTDWPVDGNRAAGCAFPVFLLIRAFCCVVTVFLCWTALCTQGLTCTAASLRPGAAAPTAAGGC